MEGEGVAKRLGHVQGSAGGVMVPAAEMIEARLARRSRSS